MSDYHFSQIRYNDKLALRQMEDLLAQEGIERDANLDYSVGLYDEDYNLAATGSAFGNTLRCLAVDNSHQGEGLLNQVISHLIDYQYRRGILDLFLYTKCNTALFFKDLGFYEIARVEGKVVFMENRKGGFERYLERLAQETSSSKIPVEPAAGITCSRVGAVVMNANPFTRGHRYLAETAAAACDVLHLFVVSEDASLVPFAVRERLVKEGTAHLKNIVYHRTESYMISNATFPSYFLKDSDTVIRSHAVLDIAIFGKIAAALGIGTRFVGEEPFSAVTGIYNQVMAEALAAEGMTCRVIPRCEAEGQAISASQVRRVIQEGHMEAIRGLVPETTYRYFTSEEGRTTVENIRAAADVRHY